ncbi:MAG: nuclear transport factor 2 family protein [Chloroflexi bacterium]|nr:nuclear transport factor 2 family protein [Chloroflexota bacterium]
MSLVGKGYYIWKISRCEGGDPRAIARVAAEAGLTHILVKVADGTGAYNYDWQRRRDLVPPLVQALRERGIAVWGWQYVYGEDPINEARIAVSRVQHLGLDGFVIDAEVEYKNRHAEARTYMRHLRSGLPDTPLALSSFRYPSYHPRFPWKEFLEGVDINMPQVYWITSHNPGAQLRRTVAEFQRLRPWRPIVATGSAYPFGSWRPSVAEIREFMRTAQELDIPAVNFWEWYQTRERLPREIWQAIAEYDWGTAPPPPPPPPPPPTQDMVERYIAALNTNDADAVAALYTDHAVHVNPDGTIVGKQAIRQWYARFFRSIAPQGRFLVTQRAGEGHILHFTWQGAAAGPKVLQGRDTIGLLNDHIAYHYTYFTVLGVPAGSA